MCFHHLLVFLWDAVCQSLSATFCLSCVYVTKDACKTKTNTKIWQAHLSFCCSAVFQTVTMLRLRGCAWARKTFLICLSVNMSMGIRDVFSLCSFSTGASNDLSTCWAFQSGFYFDLHQQGMEWSRLGLSPSEPLWTSQSCAWVQSWDATPLIYYSEVILRLWIKRQLNYVFAASKAGPEQFRMDGLHELRRRDKRDRRRCLILLIGNGNFIFRYRNMSIIIIII